MRAVTSDIDLVAYCGLYCGACNSYLKEKCPGCHGNQKASWCDVRKCCIERGYSSCADCKEFAGPERCGKFNSLIARVVGFVLRSDRAACIRQIMALGVRGHADTMAHQRQRTIRKGR